MTVYHLHVYVTSTFIMYNHMVMFDCANLCAIHNSVSVSYGFVSCHLFLPGYFLYNAL